MNSKDKLIVFIIICAIFFGFIYLISPILAPFIFAVILSYFLNPLVDKTYHKLRIPRIVATLLILTSFITAIVGIFIWILPKFYEEFIRFLATVPLYFEIIIQDYYPKLVNVASKAGVELEKNLIDLFSSKDAVKAAQNFATNAFGSTIAIINILSLIFITPILVFYLLNDWEVLIKKIKKFLPKDYKKSIIKVSKDIDKTLSSYLRGQFHVCFILGTIYAVSLSLIGLNFGVVIGFLTGFFSFIPYIGMLIGVTVALVIALFQWGFDASNLMALALVFAIGQVIEGNLLTPNLIGSKIGTHPVWIIFGLFVFGLLFGFLGILVAVPLTATLSTIIKHLAEEYRKKYAK